MIKAVIFDMGGVLLRTDNRAPREALAAKYGMSYDEIDALVFDSDTAQLAAVGEIPVEAHWASVGRKLNLSSEETKQFEADFWEGDALDGELIAFIQSLRPRYRTGLLSNAWSDVRESVTRRFSLLDSFDAAIFSAEARMAKPDAKIYQLVLEELGIEPEEAIFVDDMKKNVDAARALGMKGVVFQNTNQAKKELLELLNHHS